MDSQHPQRQSRTDNTTFRTSLSRARRWKPFNKNIYFGRKLQEWPPTVFEDCLLMHNTELQPHLLPCHHQPHHLDVHVQVFLKFPSLFWEGWLSCQISPQSGCQSILYAWFPLDLLFHLSSVVNKFSLELLVHYVLGPIGPFHCPRSCMVPNTLRQGPFHS